jgi:hypothetical protein
MKFHELKSISYLRVINEFQTHKCGVVNSCILISNINMAHFLSACSVLWVILFEPPAVSIICLKGQLTSRLKVIELRLYIPEQWQYAVGRSSTGLSCVQFQLQLCRVDIDQLVQVSPGSCHPEAQPTDSLHVHSTLSVTPPGCRSPQYIPGSVSQEHFNVMSDFEQLYFNPYCPYVTVHMQSS